MAQVCTTFTPQIRPTTLISVVTGTTAAIPVAGGTIIYTGEPFTIRCNCTNTGNTAGSATVAFYIDGAQQESKTTGTISAGATVTVTTTNQYTVTTVKSYSVCADIISIP